MVEVAQEEIRYVKPGALRLASYNPRRDAGDVKDLVTSIRSIGLLEPLVCSANGEGFEVRLGQRRFKAVKEAGLEEIPIVVHVKTEAQWVEAQLAENLKRAELSPLEEAEGYAKLAELGLTQRDIAAKFEVSQSHISKRLSLLEIPEPAKDALDAGGITIEDALELRRLDVAPDRVEKAIKASANPYTSMKRAVDAELQEHAAAERKRTAKERAKSEGIKFVGYPNGYSSTTRILGKPKDSYAAGMYVPFTKAQHKGEPCHAAALSPSWAGQQFVYVCTEPERHNKKGESKLKLPKDVTTPGRATSSGPSKAQQEKAEAERKALDEADTRRGEWITRFLGELRGRKVGKDEIADVIAAALIDNVFAEEGIGPALEALGIEAKRVYSLTPKGRAYIEASPANRQRFAFAVALFAEHEDHRKELAEWYVGVLTRYGYEWSDVERKAYGIKAATS